ncbi:hypothetical protein [Arthrobacter antioxidans]|uniref:hypothetical protein n=1 Tax=Arthrobacter antioxidans TaxID=2895818 RepID=UPI001FFFE6C7|nr:hypothetical protein [Arthrobacter antioxidans]
MTPDRPTDPDRGADIPRPARGAAPLLPLGARLLIGVAAVVFAVSLGFVLAYTTSVPVVACVVIGLALAGAQVYALRRALFRGGR